MLTIFVIFTCSAIWVKVCKLCLRGKYRKNDNVLPKTPVRLAMIALMEVKRNISKESCECVSAMLSSILRTYLSQIFPYVHIEMTDPEIIEALRKDANNDWQILSQISEIFSLTERVNFAKKKLSVAQQRGLYKKTGKIVLKIWRTKKGKYANR